MSTLQPADQRPSAPMLHDSFIELPARERARSLLDAGSFRELLGPFDKIESPWLPLQGVVCQADDGCVIARGTHRRRTGGGRRDRIGVPGRQHRRSVGQQDRRRAGNGAARLRARQDRAAGRAVRNRRRAASGSESRSRGDRRNAGGDRRAAPPCAGGRRDRGHGRLLRRHVARGRAVLVSGRDETGAARHERPRSDRTGSRHRRTRFERPASRVATDRRRTARGDRARRSTGRRRRRRGPRRRCAPLSRKACRPRIAANRSTRF